MNSIEKNGALARLDLVLAEQRRRSRQRAVRIALVLVGLAPFAELAYIAGPMVHPSDTTLLDRFDANRTMFAQLVAMSDSDARVNRIDPTFTRLDSNWAWPRPDSLLGFSRTRWDQYRAIFRQLKLERGLSRERLPDGTRVVHLIASSMGIVNRGSAKGYAYSTGHLSPLAVSLDRGLALRSDRRGGVVYREIGDGWYLEYDW